MATFNEDIKPIFEGFVGCMRMVQVASEDGAEEARLDDYEFVRRFHKRILARLKGKNEFGQNVPVMPPGNPLPPERIRVFEDWIEEGMPEGPVV